jgi:hypothetical protein
VKADNPIRLIFVVKGGGRLGENTGRKQSRDRAAQPLPIANVSITR